MGLQRRGGISQDSDGTGLDDELIAPGGNTSPLGGGASGLGAGAGAPDPSIPTPDPGAAPLAPPPVGAPGKGGNSSSPVDLNPGAANPNVSRVSPAGANAPGQGGSMTPTPSMPSSPTPVVAQPPTPFTPISPTMSDQASVQPDVSRVTPFGGPGGSPGGLLGKAGGLLGGGLGVGGGNPNHGNDPYGNPDIQTLLKLLGAQ